ncbi:conserved hypothetical protein [Neospora caninum Liverpool]|uniref:Uncharacterized protein n=1 Tax=Neospora caninum (strain Liverpool) TaxID=572307 RepID=F0VMH1_NEOCL|nr:conserved hypothetical protein [Neospora caninum Liverpool]CBZ54917.1 conserved hypothetical protein [Neospora caninum Liverpool]CEL69639.1 TPA: hypothetical protein BN1204_053430 [Neospora caninum Liverpool]|eukprot:XP_003884945.1 conserved hypothetical protein [Neospora caninum Liverpool]
MPFKKSTVSSVAAAKKPCCLFRNVSRGLSSPAFRRIPRKDEKDAGSQQPRVLFPLCESEGSSDAACQQAVTAEASCASTRSGERMRDEDLNHWARPEPNASFVSLREPPCFFRRAARRQDRRPAAVPREAVERLRFPVNQIISPADRGRIEEKQQQANEAFVGFCENRQTTQKRLEAAAAAAFLVRRLLLRSSVNSTVLSSSASSPRLSSSLHPFPAPLAAVSSLPSCGAASCPSETESRRHHRQQRDSVSAASSSTGSTGSDLKTKNAPCSNRLSSFAPRDALRSLPACHERGEQRPDDGSSPLTRPQDVPIFPPTLEETEGADSSERFGDSPPSGTLTATSVSGRAECRGGTYKLPRLPHRRANPNGFVNRAGDAVQRPFHDSAISCVARQHPASAQNTVSRPPEQQREDAVGDDHVAERHERTTCRSYPGNWFSTRSNRDVSLGFAPLDKMVERAVVQGHFRLLNVALTEALARASSPQELFRLAIRFRDFLIPANVVTALHALARMNEGRGNGWVDFNRDKKEATANRQTRILHPCVMMLLGHLVGSRKARMAQVSSETAAERAHGQENDETTPRQNGEHSGTRVAGLLPLNRTCGKVAREEDTERTDDTRTKDEADPSRLSKLSPRHLPVALWSVAKLLRQPNGRPKRAILRGEGSDILSRQVNAETSDASEQKTEPLVVPSALHVSPQVDGFSMRNADNRGDGGRDRTNFCGRDLKEQQDLLCTLLCGSLGAVEIRAAELAPQGITMVAWALAVFCEDKFLRQLSRNRDFQTNFRFQSAFSALGRRISVLLEKQARTRCERTPDSEALGRPSAGEPVQERPEKMAEHHSCKTRRSEERQSLSVSSQCSFDTSEGQENFQWLLAKEKGSCELATDETSEPRSSKNQPHTPVSLKIQGHKTAEKLKIRGEQLVGPREVCTYLWACSKARTNDWRIVLTIISMAFQPSDAMHLANVPANFSPQAGHTTRCAPQHSVLPSYPPYKAGWSSSKPDLPCRMPPSSSSSAFSMNFLPQCTPQDILSLIQALQAFFPHFQALLAQRLSPGQGIHSSSLLSPLARPETRSVIFATYGLPLEIVCHVEHIFPHLSPVDRTRLSVSLLRLANSRRAWEARAQSITSPCDPAGPTENLGKKHEKIDTQRRWPGGTSEGEWESTTNHTTPHVSSFPCTWDTADVVVVAIRKLLCEVQPTGETPLIQSSTVS